MLILYILNQLKFTDSIFYLNSSYDKGMSGNYPETYDSRNFMNFRDQQQFQNLVNICDL